MPPSGLAILIGAGPTTGAGIARMLASPSHGNLAVALLSRTGDAQLADKLAKTSGGGILKAFQTDTSEKQLSKAFEDIKSWSKSIGDDLKLKLSIYNIKHSHKVSILEETAQQYTQSMETYATGAVLFSQLSLKWMLDQYPEHAALPSGAVPMQKKGTIIFTGTLGSVRCSTAQFAAYGGGRAAVRMLAQGLAREYSAQGIHVVHAIANGGITDNYHKYHADESGKIETEGGGEDAEAVLQGKKMRAESVGKLYLHAMEQECDLWIHELDMRPAAEKF
ncbi:hypothetical protein LTR05_006677 [Lithohypha guttulata]|uniref:NAD(P)-binding protein n=1 Tax=Lithohypha guttulata TaxID=1690604 RepID=A0AAN7SWR4_9EURO|nr:hypothetical protein LTR05_006677 [Lithohypha guttulata]